MELSRDKPRPRRGARRRPSVECLVDAKAALAQGLAWDAQGHRLFWVDTPSGQLFCVSLTSGVVQSWPLPCAVGAVAPCDDGRLLMVLLDGVYLFDPATHDLHFFAGLDTGWSGEGLISGAVGPDGAFWIGGAGLGMDGSVIRISPDGSAARIAAPDALVPFGLGWSADDATMYAADLDGGWIGRWAFDPGTGGLSDGARIAARGAHLAMPAGGAVDNEGAYWSCDAFRGCISRFATDGELLMQVPMPVPAPTACCFGGADMRLLFVACRRSGLNGRQLRRSPAAGGIFMIPVDVAGVPARKFRMGAGSG